MSINPYGRGAYRAIKPEAFVSTRSQLDELQRQLVTKQKSETYGGLGTERRTSLDLNAKVAKIDSWLKGIERADVNLDLTISAVEGYAAIIDDFIELTNESRSDSNGGLYTPDASGRSVSQTLAEAQLAQSIDLLNSQVNGRFLFSGRAADTLPVVGSDAILKGDASGDGLITVIDERRRADLGTGGLGRLIAGGAGATATLSEEAVAHDYGFAIKGIQTLSTALVTADNAGPPRNLSVDVVAPPLAGEILRIELTLPDGTTEEIELRARAAGSSVQDDTFEIDPLDNTVTAANLRAALTAAVGREARTSLAASSAIVAGQAFFAGSNGAPVVRVTETPPETAVLAPSAVAGATVTWYVGDDATNPPARGTTAVQVGENQSIGIGSRANEATFKLGLAQFAVFAAATFPASDADSPERYAALVDRVNAKVRDASGENRPANLITELGTAQKSLASAKERNEVTQSYLETTLTGVQNVSSEEVAAQILQLQTQLQATYEVTSILSKLTLTNYL